MLGVMNLSFISSSDIFRKSPILPIIQNYAAKIIIIPQFPKPPSPPNFPSPPCLRNFLSFPSPPNFPCFPSPPILPILPILPIFPAFPNLPFFPFANFKEKPTYSPILYFRYSYPLGRANNKRKMSKV